MMEPHLRDEPLVCHAWNQPVWRVLCKTSSGSPTTTHLFSGWDGGRFLSDLHGRKRVTYMVEATAIDQMIAANNTASPIFCAQKVVACQGHFSWYFIWESWRLGISKLCQLLVIMGICLYNCSCTYLVIFFAILKLTTNGNFMIHIISTTSNTTTSTADISLFYRLLMAYQGLKAIKKEVLPAAQFLTGGY